MVERYGVNKLSTNPVQGGHQKITPIATPTEGLNNLSGAMNQFAVERKAREDADVVRRAYSELQDYTRDYLYGQEGVYNTRKGSAAKGASGEAGTALAKKYEELKRNHISSPEQEEKFNALFTTHRGSTLDGLSRYESEQFRVAEKASVDAVKGAAVDLYNDIASNAPGGNLLAIDNELRDKAMDITDSIRAQGQLDGTPPEVIDQQIREQIEALHGNAVLSSIDKNPQAAFAYYSAYKDDIGDELRSRLEGVFKTANTKQGGLAEARSIQSQTGDYAEQLTLARQIKDAELQEEAIRLLDADYARVQRIKQDRIEQIETDVVNQIDKSGGSFEVNTVQWHRLPKESRSALRSYASAVIKGNAPRTNWAVYTKILQMDKQDLAAANALSYRNDLGDTEYKTISKMIADARKPLEGEDFTAVRNIFGTAKSYLEKMNIEDGEEKFNLFMGDLQERITAYEKTNQTKITPEEGVKLINTLIQQTVTDTGAIYDSEYEVPNLNTDDRKSAYVKVGDTKIYTFDGKPGNKHSVPPAHRRAIIAELTRQRLPVTEANIADWYVKGLKKTKGRP